MAKRRRADCLMEAGKPRDPHSSIDRISLLPDDLLASILSRLTFKETAATSILSRRWRYMWIFASKLHFDGINSLLKVDVADKNRKLALDKERSNYIRCVDRVIALHKNFTIEEFRIFFNLNKTNRYWIDRWLRFALSRKVQRLELNLTNDASWESPRDDDEYYTFPYYLMHTNKGNFSDTSESWSTRRCDAIDFKSLKTISMNNVNVNGETLEFFLCNCPLLEDLSVSESNDLLTLKVIGPFPKFKRLEISSCHELSSVEIRDANLVYLKYEGHNIPFLLENVPLLVDLYVGGALTNYMEDVVSLFSGILPQLETCTLEMLILHLSWEETHLFYSSVKMSKLKQLLVKVAVRSHKSLLPLANLISASPCLQRFVVEVLRSDRKFVTKKKKKKKVRKIESCYAHLKEVEFVGYSGLTSDLELVMHFLDNAVALEKIVVNPCKFYETRFDRMLDYTSRYKDRIIEEEESARTRAKKQLINIVPPRIKLEILDMMFGFGEDIW